MPLLCTYQLVHGGTREIVVGIDRATLPQGGGY